MEEFKVIKKKAKEELKGLSLYYIRKYITILENKLETANKECRKMLTILQKNGLE